MRLACDISNLCNRFGDERVFQIFHQVGFECIDYSFNEIKPLEKLLDDDYCEKARQFREMLDETGLVCNQAHAPFQFAYGEKMDCSEPHYRDIVRTMEFAAIMGASRIVIHAVTVPETIDIDTYNRQYYHSFLPYCEQFGIEIAVENIARKHSQGENLVPVWDTPEELCRFIRSLESPWFCACVDLGHAAIMTCPPEKFISRMDSSLLKALHVHDTNFHDDCHTLPYLQHQDWEAIMRALATVGYKGDFNLEILLYTEHFPDEVVVSALQLAADVGHYLIKQFQKYK